MKFKNLLLLVTLLSSSVFLFAQKNNWTRSSDRQIKLEKYMERKTIPTQYDVWQIDFQSIKQQLDKAPMEFSTAQPIVFQMPIPEVGLVDFKVVESPVYAAELRANFPIFKTFSAVGGERNQYSARFDYTSNGFNAVINTPKGEVYIDPYATEQKEFCIAYFTSNHLKKNDEKPFVCGTDHGGGSQVVTPNAPLENTAVARAAADLVTLRKYRLGLACTGEFAAKHGGTKASVLSFMVTLVNRCNNRFNNELAIRFELLAKNDTLINLNAKTDPYPQGDAGKVILSTSSAVIKSRVGDPAFDIGHTLTGGCTDVGGVAFAGVICVNGSKGSGVSCDQGGGADAFAVTIMCHEMGHQFSASHTMSACGNGTDQSQVASSSAIETGSGTTIMSYDGSCGSDNVTGNYWHGPNDVYSVGSLDQMMNYSRVSVGNGCPEKITTTNHVPVVTIPFADGFTIPIQTPFELTASATDEDKDPINYSWEQADRGMYVPLGTKKKLFNNTFRTFPPVASPTRIFPRLDDILAGKTTKVELYPDTSRTYTFRCVVRDNNANGGGTVWDEVKFKSSHLAGPFQVIYPLVASDTLRNSEYTVVKWNVAGTDKNPVNCQRVNILLSTDGGYTYPTALLKNTANDGEEGVIIPSGTTSVQARIKVAAADNVFFNISNKNVVVKASNKVGFTMVASSDQPTVCLPGAATVDIQSSTFGGFGQKIKLSIENGLPVGAVAKFAKDSISPSENTTLNIDMSKVTLQGTYNIKIKGIAGKDTLYRTVAFKTIYANFSDLSLATPNDGANGLSLLPSFKWNPSAVAETYDFQIATNPAFTPQSIIFTKKNSKAVTLDEPVALAESSVYFWRIRATNVCKSGDYSTPFAFSTIVQICKESKKDEKINIGGVSTKTYESTATVIESGKASDVNILGIKGYHGNISDLELVLENPLGKKSNLFANECPSIDANFNLSFDDQSPNIFNCSALNVGNVYKPTTALSIFNNDEIKGDWKLKVTDNTTGNGGELLGWTLKFCFAQTITAPQIIVNDTLRVQKGGERYLDIKTLLAKTAKNNPYEIKFTLVTAPENGVFKKYGVGLKVGDAFSQFELNNGKVLSYYNSTLAASNFDYFLFIITDAEGGFLGTLKYNIIRDAKAPTIGTKNIELEKMLNVFPNPSNQLFNVVLSGEDLGNVEMNLFNVQGQKIANQRFSETSAISTEFDVQTLPNGIYYLEVNTSKGFTSKKLVVQH